MTFRLKRPLDPEAERAARADLLRNYPEFERMTFDPTDPSAAPYRQYWRERYLHHGGKTETREQELEKSGRSCAADEMQTCPLARENVPIIVLPGIMGSRLYFPDIDVYWDPDAVPRSPYWDPVLGFPIPSEICRRLAMLHWVWLDCERLRGELHYESKATVLVSNDSSKSPSERSWRGVSRKYYGEMLEELHKDKFLAPANKTCPVYAVGYDFRQTNAESSEAVATRVREILRDEHAREYIIITHSMGGLVARSMLDKHADLAGQAKGVIHVMQPAWGAPIFYYYCFAGMSGIPGLALGNTGEEFMTVASGQRGAVELLPNNAFVESHAQGKLSAAGWLSYTGDVGEIGERGWPGDVYDMYLLDSMESPGLMWMAKVLDSRRGEGAVQLAEQLGDRIKEARAFHNKLGQYSVPGVTWAIHSHGVETCVGVSLTFRRDAHEVFQKLSYIEDRPGVKKRETPDGDGTVPAVSADGRTLTPEARRDWVCGAEHDEGCTDKKLILVVKDVLNKILHGE